MLRNVVRKSFGEERLRQLDLVQKLVQRELSVKYRGSVLGYFWSMLSPLLFMGVISVVFSFMVKGIPHYHLFVLSGILLWNLIANSIMGGTQSIVGGSALLRKVSMPAWIFPLIPALTFSINFVLALIPYFLLFIFTGPSHVPYFWQLPLVIVLLLVFLYGVTLILGSMNVFFRDIGHVIEPTMVMAMYATPVIYDRNRPEIPGHIRHLLGFNPLTHYVEAGRKCLFFDSAIEPLEWGIMVLCSVVSIAVGLIVFKSLRRKFIFVL